jgi:hypothetical protein
MIELPFDSPSHRWRLLSIASADNRREVLNLGETHREIGGTDDYLKAGWDTFIASQGGDAHKRFDIFMAFVVTRVFEHLERRAVYEFALAQAQVMPEDCDVPQ